MSDTNPDGAPRPSPARPQESPGAAQAAGTGRKRDVRADPYTARPGGSGGGRRRLLWIVAAAALLSVLAAARLATTRRAPARAAAQDAR